MVHFAVWVTVFVEMFTLLPFHACCSDDDVGLFVPVVQINVPTDLDGGELSAEKADRREFIDLLKRMLTLDQDRRIRPVDALGHTFIVLGHLVEYLHLNVYVSLTVFFHLGHNEWSKKFILIVTHFL